MADLAHLLHDISLAFATSSDIDTLLPRLSTVMAASLPVIELEAVFLDEDEEQALIQVLAPGLGRDWQGQRSARFFTRQRPDTTTWVEDHEPARVASAPVESQLIIPLGMSGMLRVSFSVPRGEIMEDRLHTDMLVDLLSGQAQRLGEFDNQARQLRALHRQVGDYERAMAERQNAGADHRNTEDVEPSAPEPVLEEPAPEAAVAATEPALTSQQAELPLRMPQHPPTEIRVKTLDMALIECISGALRATSGRIYGTGGAAELLGLKPSTLQSKMRKLGIERRSFAS